MEHCKTTDNDRAQSTIVFKTLIATLAKQIYVQRQRFRRK